MRYAAWAPHLHVDLTAPVFKPSGFLLGHGWVSLIHPTATRVIVTILLIHPTTTCVIVTILPSNWRKAPPH
eukprot:g77130.t1